MRLKGSESAVIIEKVTTYMSTTTVVTIGLEHGLDFQL